MQEVVVVADVPRDLVRWEQRRVKEEDSASFMQNALINAELMH